MNHFWLSLLIIFTVTSINFKYGICGQDTYLIGIQQKWFKGFNQTLFITIYDKSLSKADVDILINVVNVQKPEIKYQVNSVIRAPTYTGLVSFQVPSYFEQGYYDVTIEGRANNFYFKNSTKNIQYRTDVNGIYIITDKPVYRALDQVNVKIVGIDGSLLPIKENTISVYFLDPNYNIIKQYVNMKFDQGLIQNITLDISDKPQLGTYQIKVVQNNNGNDIIKRFEIMEYVLPKFDFSVSVPEYVLRNDDYIQGTIDAKYTYGKPLDGEAYIKLESKNGYWVNTYSIGYETFFFKVERIIKLNNGKTTFSLPYVVEPYNTLELSINVTEEFTKETKQKKFSISTYDNSFSASINPKVFVTGSNTFSLEVVDPRHKPLPNVNFAVDYSFITGPFDSQLDKTSYILKTKLDGTADLTIDVRSFVTHIILNIRRLDTNEKYKLVLFKQTKKPENSKEDSSTDKEFKFKLKEKLKANSMAKVLVSRSKNGSKSVSLRCDDVAYIVTSRSMVLSSGTVKLCNDKRLVEINFPVSYINAPHSTIVLYYINAENTLVVQSQKVEINGIYNNEIVLEFDKSSAEPGEHVQLSIKTKPNSIASVVVVDQSVQLFRTPNELTNDMITDQISNYQNNYHYSQPISRMKRYIYDGCWQYPQSMQNLEQIGFVVLSDLSSLEPKYRKYDYYYRPLMSEGFERGTGAKGMPGFSPYPGIQSQMLDMPDGVGTTRFRTQTDFKSHLAPVERIRTNFQETWLWTTLQTDQNGNAVIQSPIPDTITSWIASGFSLSDTFGIAIANKTNITSFKPFFVSLILPSSIIRGEIFILQAVVSNYMNEELRNVFVTLVKSADFKKVSINVNNYSFNDINDDLVLIIPSIPPGSARSVSFPIVATKAGLIELTVKAQTTIAADAESKKLRVKFEGIQETYNTPYLVDLGSDRWLLRSETFSKEVGITFPNNTIQDSQYCEVQVIGDLLGVAFSNLDQLIVKPYGCGEQNMVTLTPNIYAYNYLQVVKRPNSKSLIDKIKANILFGYQNELKYRHPDGSFSAFGTSDNNGSSWLTAFVVKSFSQAANIVAIDENIITTAISWLLQQQNVDGSFREPGHVISKDMQSGVNNIETQTAYIAISLLETNITTSNVTNSIRNALFYLDSKLDSINDVYALSLLTYAMTLGGSSYSEKAFSKFNTLANTTIPGYKYWSKVESDTISRYYWRRPAPTNGIEMTSYGLLTYLLRNDISDSVSIVRWLTSQSNSLGSYGSTQSTVLGLQALSTFGMKTNSDGNFDVTIRVDASSDQIKTFKVNNDNSLVLQSWQLNSCPTLFKIDAIGSGTAFVQVIATYNLEKMVEPPAFELTQTVKSKISNSNYLLQTCARYTGKDGSTGMSIIESNILSGFSADKIELNGLIDGKLGLQLVELSNDRSKVSFYFNELNNRLKCITWNIRREYPIALQQAVSVRVYDYYKPEMQKTILFSTNDNVGLCDLTNEIDDCVAK